jgi:hypothetical protein
MSALPKEAVNNDETAHSASDGAASDCSLVQRLLNGDAAGGASSLWPTLTPLQTKLGRKAGDGFVIKPKAGANKVSFDKHNLALQALPLVTLGADTAALKAGETCKVLVMFANPLDKPVTLTFGDTASAAEAQAADEKRLQEEDEAGVMDEDEDAYPKVAAVATAAATCACTPPSVSVTVGKYDDIAEQNDLVKTAESALQDGDDAAVVGYRKLSKVGVFVEVTPAAGTEGEATCSFMVTVAVEGSSSTDDLPFNSTCVQVQLSLGKVA